MSKRIEQSRKHGPFDPRYTKLVRLATRRKPSADLPSLLTDKADAGPSVPS